MSCVFADAKSHVSGAENHRPIGRDSRRSRTVLGVPDERLELVMGLLRRRDLHELDFVELMLPDQPSDIGAVVSPLRSGSTAYTRCSAAEAGDRRGSRFDGGSSAGPQQLESEEIPIAGDLEEILLELRQVAGAAQCVGIDEERRLHLDVTVLLRVELEHEIDQRAREPRARAEQHRESRARTFAWHARNR